MRISRSLQIPWRLFVAALSVAFVFLLVFNITSALPARGEAEGLRTDGSAHDPVDFAVTLSEHLPESPTGVLTQDLADWIANNPAKPARWWTLQRAVAHVTVSYFVCFCAMGVAGFLGFLVFRYLAFPAPPRRKAVYLLAFVLLSGIPTAILGWIFSFISGPWGELWSSLPEPEFFKFLQAELIILICLVLGDGLAGIMLLKARSLTAGDSFSQRVAAIWASNWLKGPAFPLPGTASLYLWKEVFRRTFSAWSGLLGRFLLSEIGLEFLLAHLTKLPTHGVGHLLIRSIVEGGEPFELAATAALLTLPIALLRACSFPEEER